MLVLLIYRLFPCPTAAVVWRHHAAMATYLALLGLESAWEWLAPQSSIIPIATAAIIGYTVIFLVWAKIIGPIPAEPAPSRAGDADRLDAEQVSLQANISQARALVKPKREPDE